MQQTLRFALFGNTYQEHKSAHVTHLLEILRRRKAQICISNEFYDFLRNHTKADLSGLEVFEGNNFSGDGKGILHTCAEGRACPSLIYRIGNTEGGTGCEFLR